MSDTNTEFPRGVEVSAVAIIKNTEGKILLCTSKKDSNKWVLPGGHIEPGEKILDAAVREAKEETNLDTTAVAIVDFGEIINPPHFHRTCHFIYFDCLLLAKTEDASMQEEELTDSRWVTPEEALSMDLATGYEKDIQGYIRYLSAQPE